MRNQLLGIDWGTSNRRAYLLDPDGQCVARHADDQGLLAVGGRFAQALDSLRAMMGVDAAVPVLMSGMVGSASGWQEVPYLDSTVPLAQLPRHTAPLHGQPGCAIVPGYVWRGDGIDVMRGEETQLLGALALGTADGWLVLPGTHSKWVWLENGCVRHLHTYMTGELYALLGSGGTLGALMAAGGADDAVAFNAGLDAARAANPLTHALFGARARVVTGAMPASSTSAYVSGLLVGAEFAAAQARGARHIALIASPALSARYAVAAARYGMALQVLDPDRVYCAALAQFLNKA